MINEHFHRDYQTISQITYLHCSVMANLTHRWSIVHISSTAQIQNSNNIKIE